MGLAPADPCGTIKVESEGANRWMELWPKMWSEVTVSFDFPNLIYSSFMRHKKVETSNILTSTVTQGYSVFICISIRVFCKIKA